MRRNAILLAWGLALSLALPALATEDDFHWQGKVAPSAAVEIKGSNGGIEIRKAAATKS
jgi:hypothetical protein